VADVATLCVCMVPNVSPTATAGVPDVSVGSTAMLSGIAPRIIQCELISAQYGA